MEPPCAGTTSKTTFGDGQGHLTHQLPSFCEAIETLDYAEGRLLPAHPAAAQSTEAEAYAALTLGVRDYLGKNGFPSALIGMSGGVDSALTLAIAVDALGAARVRAVMMPSPYTARALRRNRHRARHADLR